MTRKKWWITQTTSNINSIVSHLLGHVQKLVQVHTSVGELPEGTLLLDLGICLKHRSINHVSV